MSYVFPCPKCNGKGRVSFKHIADGICFQCSGKGTLSAKERAKAPAAQPATPINQLATADQRRLLSRLAYKLSPQFKSEADLYKAALPDIDLYGDLLKSDASKIIGFAQGLSQ